MTNILLRAGVILIAGGGNILENDVGAQFFGIDGGRRAVDFILQRVAGDA